MSGTHELGGTAGEGVYSPPDIVTWGSSLDLRSSSISSDFNVLLSSKEENDSALVKLYKHGILRVYNVPTDHDGQWKLAECFSGGSKDDISAREVRAGGAKDRRSAGGAKRELPISSLLRTSEGQEE